MGFNRQLLDFYLLVIKSVSAQTQHGHHSFSLPQLKDTDPLKCVTCFMTEIII